MADISQKVLMGWLRKTGQVILILLGTTFSAYNLTAFKVDQFGVYYHDDNQLWLAFGIAALTISWLIRNWKQI